MGQTSTISLSALAILHRVLSLVWYKATRNSSVIEAAFFFPIYMGGDTFHPSCTKTSQGCRCSTWSLAQQEAYTVIGQRLDLDLLPVHSMKLPENIFLLLPPCTVPYRVVLLTIWLCALSPSSASSLWWSIRLCRHLPDDSLFYAPPYRRTDIM